MLTFTDSRVPREYRFALVDCLTKETIWGPKKYNYQVKWGLLDQDYSELLTEKETSNFSESRMEKRSSANS